MGIGAAIIGGAALAGTAGIAGSAMASSAQRDSANTSANTQMNMYNQNRGLLTPWNDSGYRGYQTLSDLMGIGGNSSTMQKTLEGLPGYQFTRDQGLKSVQNSAAGRGLGTSGAALKGAAGYATGFANSTYGQYAGQLQNFANTGAGAAKAIAGVGSDTGANIGASQIAAGNASAAGYNGAANSVSNAAGALPLYAMLNNGSFGGGGQVSGPFNNFDLSMVP